MELWLGKDDRQRVLWPAVVELSPRYFESLTRHAVPLDERAVAALSNSPMALDVYAWLGQRLCRVSSSRGQFVSWASLYDQFGQGFVRMRKFRETFLGVLRAVQSQYRQAKFETDERFPRAFGGAFHVLLGAPSTCFWGRSLGVIHVLLGAQTCSTTCSFFPVVGAQ
jgi:hypothetical protein